jgi:hypothetical protein
MLNPDELLILAAAAIASSGEYLVQRDWNKRWARNART